MSVPHRHLPVRPDLEQLRRQAKDLLRDACAGDPHAVAELAHFHPDAIDPAQARLADAQLALARAYEASSWPRLVQACELVSAIWRDDLAAVVALVERNPSLIHEDALVRKGSNWGPPMSYAANVGRDAIIRALYERGARDVLQALDRAALQGKIATARMLHAMLDEPRLPSDPLGGAAYTLSDTGTALMLELGAQVVGPHGERLAPVDILLETDSRKPAAKHRILEMYVAYGLSLPDTPPMAVHRGRIDLLEAHLARDPGLLTRRFAFEEIYPPSLGCHDEVLATHGTPLGGATLLHMAVDYDEMELARWLLARGMPVDTPALVDADGFGGHTALFATVVSQPNYERHLRQSADEAPFTRLLLEHGADPKARASLRKQLHPGYGETAPSEYRDVTPLAWGERFHRQEFVSREAMRLIEKAGGGR